MIKPFDHQLRHFPETPMLAAPTEPKGEARSVPAQARAKRGIAVSKNQEKPV